METLSDMKLKPYFYGICLLVDFSDIIPYQNETQYSTET